MHIVIIQLFKLRTFNWQSVENIINYQYCIAVFKILNDMAPHYLYYVTSLQNAPCIMLLAIQPYLKTKYMQTSKKKSFSFTAPSIYNKLPTQIRTASTLLTFKNQIRPLSLSFYYIAMAHCLYNHYYNIPYHSRCLALVSDCRCVIVFLLLCFLN